MQTQNLTLNQTLLLALDTHAQRPCLKIKQGQHYQDISYHYLTTLTFRFVRFFQRQGIANGERVVLAAKNSPEWLAAYLGCLLAGGAVVPLHITNVPDTLHFILRDCGARLAILEERGHLQKAVAGLDPTHADYLPDLEKIVTTSSGGEPLPQVTPLKQFLTEPLSAEDEEAIRTQAQNIAPEAIALLYYVTSASGQPKGAVFDQARLQATLTHMAAWFQLTDDDVAFTLRPWSEYPSLVASLHYFVSGVTNALWGEVDPPEDDMQQVSPTVMLAMPNIYELYYEDRMNWLATQPEADRKIFQWALKKGREYRTAGAALSPEERQEYIRADLTFFNQLRGDVGGRVRRLYAAMAPPPDEVCEFFMAIGLPILATYSLAEAGGFPTISRPQAGRPGTCGQVAPGYEVRLANDGEILIRSAMMMREYWQRPGETARFFDEAGWLRSGDVGHLDNDGYLYVTGRKGHMLLLSNGRKVAPIVIETALTDNPFITQAALIGEGKPHLSVMLVLDLEALIAHFEGIVDETGHTVDTTTHPLVKQLLEEEIIAKVNKQLDREERITVYRLLDQPLSKEAGELTASMKISRHTVAERYAAKIEEMYPLPLQLEAAEVSQVQVEPERLRVLLEKESLLDAWLADAGIQFLFELARQKQIDAPSMVHICDAAATIAQLESEERPLSTALIVGDPTRISRVLPPGKIRLLSSDRIGRMRKNLVSLATMVDGRVLGYVLDKHGYVRGINKLEVPLEERTSFLLGPHFRHHAAISHHCDAVVFFVPAGGRQVRVFADGQLVGRYSNGDWSPENMQDIEQKIAELTERKAYNLTLVQRILRCAFQMSERNLGAIFIVGDSERVLQHSDASEINHFALIIRAPMAEVSDQELINFAKQDGATVIDAGRNEFSGCMVLLRPDAETKAEIGPGKGARHSSAAKMSAEADCLAITVSHDGPITIYDSGKRVLSL